MRPALTSRIRFNEAGAFLLRKRATRCDRRTTEQRFNEAGAFLLRKPVHPVDLALVELASMKPEHFCSGNGRPPDLEPHPVPSFNEAGAFLLRKRFSYARPDPCYARFNEAGAFLLRKHLPRPGQQRGLLAASMKPEHFCSGNFAARSIFLIRCARCFNEAGAFLLRKRRCCQHPPSEVSRFNEAGAFLLRKPGGQTDG